MDEIEKDLNAKENLSVNCPYCWANNEKEIVGNFKVVLSHPPLFRCSKEFPEAKIPFWFFWAVKSPKGVREGSVECINCHRDFWVGLFPYDSDDPKNSKDLNYYLKLAIGETEVIERKFFLEDVLDRFSDFLHIKNYALACLLFILIPTMLFWILPIIALGGFSKISHDYGFFYLFVLFVLMLIFLKHYCIEFRNVLDFKKLPLPLSEQYKNSTLGKQHEEATKAFVLGHPFQKITPPTICGLVAVAIFLVWQINFTTNIASTFYETPYFGSYPFTYTSYILSVLVIPFWAMIYFIVGNIVWIFMATIALLGLLTRYTSFDINPLKEMGGTEVFGKIMLLSLYPFATVGAGIPVLIIVGSYFQKFYGLLIAIFFVSLFVFLLAFGFFFPLWPIHKKLKEEKEKQKNEILNKISLPTIKEGMNLKEAMNTNLRLGIFNKISSMHEWPFKFDTLIKAVSTILIPFISLVVNIILFIK